MRVCLIYNPRAGAAEQIARFLSGFGGDHRCELRPTSGAGDAQRFAAEAVQDRFDRIVVAGGDGTVSRVVAGLAPHFAEIELAILPLGTGNDFSRALDLAPDRFERACALAFSPRTAAVDLIRIDGRQTSYCVNVANGGIGGHVAADLKPAAKRSWGVMAYWMTTMSEIGDLQTYQVKLTLDDDKIDVATIGVAISNGRYVGGGFPIAPRAWLNDGKLDVTVIPVLPMLDLMAAGINLTVARDQLDDHLTYYRTRRLELQTHPEMPFSIDGEQNRTLCVDQHRVVFEVLPAALRVVTGDKPLGLTSVARR